MKGLHQRRPKGRRGAALLLVLAATVLCAALLLALFASSRRQTRQAAQGSVREELQLLARLPRMLMLQKIDRLRHDAVGPEGEARLWTSQPGLIRVFSERQTPGEDPVLWRALRLYSTSRTDEQTTDLEEESQELAHWSAQRAGYTDLNQPVWRRAGAVFPIADPRALGRVEGFSSHQAPGANAAHPLPMPAAWLYVLRDGRLISPRQVTGEIARFAEEEVTAGNPIVGRIAFWTDDETCKLNVNTASEPEFADLARAFTEADVALAARVPERDEWHRCSWHPAFTALAPALGDIVAGEDKSALRQFAATTPAAVPYLFLGDLILSPQKQPWTAVRQPLGVTPGLLEQRRFFLTTVSRAPELQPWGGPKVALWPVAVEGGSEFDREVRQAAALAESAHYLFQRPSALEGGDASTQMRQFWTVPRNQLLFDYLRALSELAVPGWGAPLVPVNGAANRDALLTHMVDLLQHTVNPVAVPPAAPLLSPTDGNRGQDLRGLGRLPTFTEVAVVIVFTDVRRRPDGQPLDSDGDGYCDQATHLRAMVVLEPFQVMTGQKTATPAFCTRFRRLMHWRIGRQNQSLDLPGGSVLNRWHFAPLWTEEGGAMGFFPGLAAQFVGPQGVPKGLIGRTDRDLEFPFASTRDVPLASDEGRPGTRLPLNCGLITLDVMPAEATAQSPREGDFFQSMDLNFTPQTLTVPRLPVALFTSGRRDLTQRWRPRLETVTGPEGRVVSLWRLPLIQAGDLVRSLELDPDGPSQGDARVLASLRQVPVLTPNQRAGGSAFWFREAWPAGETSVAEAHSLRESQLLLAGQYGQSWDEAGQRVEPHLEARGQPTRQVAGRLWRGQRLADAALPAVPAGLSAALLGANDALQPGDWESGPPGAEDGPGAARSGAGVDAPRDLSGAGSAHVFGALPRLLLNDAGESQPGAWETLCLGAQPAGRMTPSHLQPGAADHPGWGLVPDHLWLELFWMPPIRPAPSRVPLAVEGKVNLNHWLIPFPWITRTTALRGALRGVRLTALPEAACDDQGPNTKVGHGRGEPLEATFRYAVDADRTLESMDSVLDRRGIFRTPSEIQAVTLVPKRLPGQRYDGPGWETPDPAAFRDLTAWWQQMRATGDNLREAPYAQLYPRLCTRSNAFRVHYRVQVLRPPRSAPPHEWREANGQIVAEERGNALIERRLELGDPDLPDPAADPQGRQSLEPFHRVRVTATEIH